jgi:hypothetical protein
MVGHLSLLLRTVDLAARSVVLADKAASHVPCYRRAKGKVLDSLLGSEDACDYVSRTN